MMLWYIVLFCVVAFVGFLQGNRSKIYLSDSLGYNFIIIALLLFQVLRSPLLGEDTNAYFQWFNDYCNLETISSLHHPIYDIDLGFSILNIIISRFTHNPHVFMIVVSAIIVLLHSEFIKHNSSNFYNGIVVFLASNLFLTSMVSWRQFIAMGIVVWEYSVYTSGKENKVVKIISLSFLGFLFHDTSIVFSFVLFVCYALSTIRITINDRRFSIDPSIFLGLYIIGLIFYKPLYRIIEILLPSLKYYNSFNEVFKIGKLRILYILLDFYLFFLLERSKKKNPVNYFYLNIISVKIILGIMSGFIPYMFRFCYYFDYFLILIIPHCLLLSKNKQISKFIFISISFLLYCYYLSYNPGYMLPYKFFWEV